MMLVLVPAGLCLLALLAARGIRRRGGLAWLVYRFLRLVSRTEHAFELIQQRGIVVFVGPNGSGKSLCMIRALMPTLAGTEWACFDPDHRHHQPFRDHAEECAACDVGTLVAYAVETSRELDDLVEAGNLCQTGVEALRAYSSGHHLAYSTVPLFSSRGKFHELFVGLRDYVQLLAIEHAVVCFDEVAGIADASGSATVPVQVVNWQHTLRKRDVAQFTTTPSYQRCALPIRQVAQLVVECKGLMPRRVKVGGRRWLANRVVRLAVYDANQFEEWRATDGQRKNVKPLAKGVLFVPTEPARLMYNTLGQVLALGHVTESGMCIVCGGTRSRPRCACPDDLVFNPDLVVIERTVSASGSRVRRAVPVAVPADESDRELVAASGRHSEPST